MNTQRQPPQPCPNCFHKLDATTGITENAWTPVPGDWSVCFFCRTALVFDADLNLRIAERADLDELPADALAALLKAQRLIPIAKARFKAWHN